MVMLIIGGEYLPHLPPAFDTFFCRFDAAHETQGVPGSSVKAQVKGPNRSKPAAHAYAVFFGHEVSAFRDWYEPAVPSFFNEKRKDLTYLIFRRTSTHSQVRGLSRTFQCGFPSLAAANKALAHARQQGWTGDSPVLRTPLPLPSSYEPNPLNSPHGGVPLAWFVVIRGVNPGIYSSG
jgi:hypothetical protein